MTYDHWKTTNPADEFLGPAPDDDAPDELLDLATARLAMVAAIMRTQAHAIRFGYADHEDLRERAEHVQAVLNAVTVYVSAVVDDTAHNSAHLDNEAARRAIAAMREADDQFGDAVGDLLGSMFNAAEEEE